MTDLERQAQDQRALDRLRPWVADIAGGASTHEPVQFVPDTWRRWLVGTPVAPIGERVLEQLGTSVERSDLKTLAREVGSDEGLLDLLLATLIWGRGKSNGRMRDHIVRALEHHHQDGQVLKRTAALAAAGRPVEAYGAWHGPGLGPAFFTKWLWASSAMGEPQVRPLILDSRVWKSLNNGLGWSSLVATGNAKGWAGRYEAYVISAHTWAKQLSSRSHRVLAEDIEWALFTAGGNLSAIGQERAPLTCG